MWRIASLVVATVILAHGGTTLLSRSAQNSVQAGQGQSSVTGAPLSGSVRLAGRARIRGRVVAANTGQPVREARVSADSMSPRSSHTAFTDDDGYYVVSGLKPAVYQVRAQKEGFLPAIFGDGRSLTLQVNETVQGIDLALRRGGVILGSVLDEFGGPVAGIQITPLRSRFAQGRRQPVPAGAGTITDDRGEFRLFGLSPGNYYVLAVARTRAARIRSTATQAVQIGYAATYFPGTAKLSEAQHVAVTADGTVAANFALVQTELGTITGRIVGGQPRGGVAIRSANGSSLGVTILAARDGTFALTVSPGKYFLRAQLVPEDAAGEGIVAAATVTVEPGEQVTDVVLEPMKMTAVTGRVVVDAVARHALQPSAIRLGVSPVDFSGYAGGHRPAVLKDDLTFELNVWPGRGLVRLIPEVAGLALKAVRLNGVDVTDDGIDFMSGRPMSGLEVELTTHPSAVTGAVTTREGQAVADYTVILFARDGARWIMASGRHVAITRSDQHGRFLVRSLPPGQYYAFAARATDGTGWADPVTLDGLKRRATPFDLRDGETKELRLVLSNRAP